jgi:hypothetical protein
MSRILSKIAIRYKQKDFFEDNIERHGKKLKLQTVKIDFNSFISLQMSHEFTKSVSAANPDTCSHHN